MDEIETHLHPQWQRRLLPALLKVVAELTGVEVQMVVTTHSPLVMISLESEFTDQDRLHLLELKDREVELRTVPFENHGLVDDWLGSEVFGRVEPRSQHAAQVVRWAKAFMRGDKDELPKEMRSVKALDAELKKVLSDMDLFGPEWMVFREKQK